MHRKEAYCKREDHSDQHLGRLSSRPQLAFWISASGNWNFARMTDSGRHCEQGQMIPALKLKTLRPSQRSSSPRRRNAKSYARYSLLTVVPWNIASPKDAHNLPVGHAHEEQRTGVQQDELDDREGGLTLLAPRPDALRK